MAAARRSALSPALAAAAALWLINAVLSPAFAGLRLGARAPKVACAASQEDIAAAEKQAQLLSWAASKLAGDGSAQAAAMQAKAAQAAQTLEALKQQGGGAAAAAPAYTAPPVAAASPAAPAAVAMPPAAGAVSPEALAAAKKDAELHAWAAQTLAAQGAPQAAAMQAKAAQKAQSYAALKQQAEGGAAFGAPVYAAPAYSAAPAAAAAPPSFAAAAGSAPSPEAVKKAKEEADLAAWAANTLATQGAPQAAALQAKAGQKLQAYKALKQQAEGGAAPSYSAPVPAPAPVAYSAPAAAPVAPASAMPRSAGGANSEALKKAKEEADLAVWAANTLAAKGAPQAAALQARAQQKLQAFEALKAQEMAMR